MKQLAATEEQMQAMQEARDIDTGVDTRTKEEMLADQMSGLSSAGKTAIENIPGVGEAIVAKEVAEDVSAGDYLSAGIGTAALGMGFLPAGDILNKPLRAAAKKFRKQDTEAAKKLMTDDDAAKTWKEANKLSESQRQKRVPEVQKAATDLSEGKITSKEYRRVVTANQPIKPITKENFPEMPTKTEIVGALKATDPRKVDTGIIGLNKNIPDGTRVGSRLDIPSYDNYDKWIVSLHDGTKKGGQSIGYGQSAVLKNVEFVSSAKGGLNIAKNKDKATIARIHGDYYNAEPENVFEAAKSLIDNPEWTQVGMNPFRHSFFYDKATGKPVTRADEVIQVGPLVLAKGVKQPTISELKSLGVKTKDGKIRMFNEGGAVMQKQMERFEDGGLMDEGGTVDPISGNDVPPGSTQEEVRDDIPAQLSEGEFVFPADVVRYIGLGNLMRMRQEAKMGLKLMDEMGQMGNSEEATIPDDIPFDINDLDMEDESEYNSEMEMAEGGLVYAQQGTFVPGTPQQQQFGISGYQQAAAPTTGFAPTPVQAASQQFVQPTTQIAQAAVPTMREYKPAEIPTFQQTIGSGFGEYDEIRQYRNEAGNVINVPFRNGQPISPIPEGYKYVDPEETATEEVTTTPTTPQTTQVRESDRDEDREEPRGGVFALGTFSENGRMGGKRGEDYFDFNVSFDTPSGSLPGMLGAGSLMAGLVGGKGLPEGAIATLEYDGIEMKVGAKEYNEAREDRTGDKAQELIGRFKQKRDEERAAARALASEYGIKYTGQSLAEMAKAANKIDEERKARDERTKAIIQKAIEESGDTGQTTGTGGAPAETFTTAGEQSIQDLLASLDSGNDDSGGGGGSSGGGRTGSSSTDWSQPDSSASVGSQSDYDKMYGNQGGLASKPKPKAKKMKRGGLASKK